jgi:signal transduction histidine kinase
VANLFRAVSRIGISPNDQEDMVLQKRTVVYQAILMSGGGLIWGTLAYCVNLTWQSAIPYGYVFLSALNLIYFSQTRNFQLVKNFQTTISLLLPFMFQCALGGFVASGAAMLWALLSLVIAVIYQRLSATYFWLALYILLTLVSGILDADFIRWFGLPEAHQYSTLFFVLNITFISAIILWLFNFIYRQKDAAMKQLKETQLQLIQTEKLASLGELTAGIAHEIQNPLNFVNNFSEVNAELIEELKQKLTNGNVDEAKDLIRDMQDNETKIVHHGRRADAIVKNMLQHSRGSSGKNEPTDINALVDEYSRLAYHGMRAREKSFYASMETNFDDSIGKLNIVPHEIGRVLLNLITNAFHAVTERMKLDGKDYQPTVLVTTKKQGDRVEIRVKDNGTGIPQKVLDKIFQPFFSTKPTGQGTGLGLSLSYDIVKAHGGELKVETEEGVGSEFIVQLPIVK